MTTLLLAGLAALAALLVGLLAGAVLWERYRDRLTDATATIEVYRRTAELSSEKLVAELIESRDVEAQRARGAEHRMREVEQMLLEQRAGFAGVAPPPPPAGPPAKPLPVEIQREIAALEDPEAQAEMAVRAQELLDAGRLGREVVAELFE